MALRAKCLRELLGSGDGERLFVARNRPRGLHSVRIDRWARELAPSTKIDFAFHRGWITRHEFRALYVTEMWSHIRQLTELARRADAATITIVCGCPSACGCHRALLARMIGRRMRFGASHVPNRARGSTLQAIA